MLNRRQFLSGLGVSSLGHGAFASAKSTPILNQLEKLDANILFMRHALAPGFGDPDTFDVTRCSTQRNLDSRGRAQAIALGQAFKKSGVTFDAVFSSQWCRCKETALIAFNKFENKNFLNSFFSSKFAKNKDLQIKNLRKFIKDFDGDENLIFVTHYVVISELLNYSSSSGEIVISDQNYNIIGNLAISFNE